MRAVAVRPEREQLLWKALLEARHARQQRVDERVARDAAAGVEQALQQAHAALDRPHLGRLPGRAYVDP